MIKMIQFNHIFHSSMITITPNGYQITLEGKADEIENFLSELNVYLD